MAEETPTPLAEDLVEDLGRILLVLRTALGLNQEDVARTARVPPSSLSNYENGVTVPETPSLLRVLQGMGLPLAALDLTGWYLESLAALRRKGGSQVASAVPVPADPAEVAALMAEFKEGVDRLAMGCLSRLFRAVPGDPGSEADPRSSESEAARTEELWNALKREPEARQRKLLQEDPRFWHPGLCERLCRESAKQASRSPRKALLLADLARLLADMIDQQSPARSLRAYAAAHWANAIRAQGKLPAAEEAFQEADCLWVEVEEVEKEAFPGYEARILDLKASLRRDQRRLTESLDLIDQALGLAPEGDRGRLLINKSKIVEETGDLPRAIALLREAEPWVDPKTDPREVLCLRHNLAWLLATAGKAEEAEALLPGVRTLSRKLNNELDLVRLQWLEARVDAGLGRTAKAIAKLNQVRGEFATREIDYDTALVTLELAALYAGQGRTAEVKTLARHLVPVFQAQKVHREAIAALTLFRDAAEREAVTVELARNLLAYLERARHDPGLRYEGRG